MKKIVKKMIRWSDRKIQHWLGNFSLKRKMLILYISCMLIPLLLTDLFIISIVIRSEQAASEHEKENIASAVQYSLSSEINQAVDMGKNIYMNRYINDFLNKQFESPLDYYLNYLDFMENTLFESSLGTSQFTIVMYSDNESIVNGAEFGRLSDVKDTTWYQHFREEDKDIVVFCYYDTSNTPGTDPVRKISLIRRLNRYRNDGCEKVLKIDLDYNKIVNDLIQMKYEVPVYVCSGGKILFSNSGSSGQMEDFSDFTKSSKAKYCLPCSFFGQDIDIYVLNGNQNIIQQIEKDLPLILILIFLNACLPWFLMRNINNSLTIRIRRLSEVFSQGCNGEETLKTVENVKERDEIGELMRNYNWMAARQNELVQTVYKERLKEQEMNIARQNAELLALHSQINPHFLFNALESIRMHSILKKEYETAHMVEMLAIMERQNVEWGTDDVTVRDETGLVQAYLELQKYRFGERLSYKIEVEDGCWHYIIPKMSLVTFVENACVHGIESKSSPGWIFVRVYKETGNLCLEVEDTGIGMKQDFLEKMQDEIANVSIENIKEKNHIGISNACLRIKMVSNDTADFVFESEEGIGTCITVKIPENSLREIKRKR